MQMNELWTVKSLESGLLIWKASEVDAFRKQQKWEMEIFICHYKLILKNNRERRWLLKNSPAFTVFKMLMQACKKYFSLSPRHDEIGNHLENINAPSYRAPREIKLGSDIIRINYHKNSEMEPVAQALASAAESAYRLSSWKEKQCTEDLEALCYNLLLMSCYAQEDETTRKRQAAADSRAGKGGALAAKYFSRQYVLSYYQNFRGRGGRSKIVKEIQKELLKNTDPKSWAAEGERARRTIREWIEPQLTEIYRNAPVLVVDEKPIRMPMIEHKLPWYD
ncbi:hypothetical protein [Phytopseudomonas daroniae]|uniref:hypothetical protein n=1 Tax=Phytopseudomonas daroniae TaxID=2487519 RepID=UPI0010384FC9|nr:hypothetical protein [Pseudomonas daroniae]TBU71487.1 hypothetical protein DNK10_23925 [Pseudomonas daroniae]